jgi:hypothetical protein
LANGRLLLQDNSSKPRRLDGYLGTLMRLPGLKLQAV